jgi:hypothetical protein
MVFETFSEFNSDESKTGIWSVIRILVWIFWKRESVFAVWNRLLSGGYGVVIPAAMRAFSVYHIVQTSYGARSTSYSMDTGVLSWV